MLIKKNKIIVIEAESVSPSLRTWTQEPQKTGRDKQKSYMICYAQWSKVLVHSRNIYFGYVWDK